MEKIISEGKHLAYVIRADYRPEGTMFLTPPEVSQQLGYIVYPKGGVVRRHVHRHIERRLEATSEVLFVREGRCLLDVYNEHHELVSSSEIMQGDVVILLAGGHGLRMLEDTVLFEVKLGPYAGAEEKELF